VIRAGYGTSGWLFRISLQIGKWLWAAVQFNVAVCAVNSNGCVDVSNGASGALSSAVEPYCGGGLVFVQAKLICWCYRPLCW